MSLVEERVGVCRSFVSGFLAAYHPVCAFAKRVRAQDHFDGIEGRGSLWLSVEVKGTLYCTRRIPHEWYRST